MLKSADLFENHHAIFVFVLKFHTMHVNRLLFGFEEADGAAFLDWRLRSISKSEYVNRSTKTLSLA
jgi:hypothetical protein